jgi:hypothetical protein
MGSRRFLAGPDEDESAPATALSTRRSGDWYGWGLDSADVLLSAEYGAGIAPNPGIPPGGGYAGYMMALPAFFPEAGTITAIACVLPGDQTGTRGWVGIARDSIYGTDHYPAATTEVWAPVTGYGTGQRRIRGGVVSLATEGGELLWWLLQDYGGFGAGSVWSGFDRQLYAQVFGLSTTAGVALDGVIPGVFTLAGGVAYQTATEIPMALGRGFPRVSVGVLSALNTQTMWGNVAMPVGLYQWTRTV